MSLDAPTAPRAIPQGRAGVCRNAHFRAGYGPGAHCTRALLHLSCGGARRALMICGWLSVCYGKASPFSTVHGGCPCWADANQTEQGRQDTPGSLWHEPCRSLWPWYSGWLVNELRTRLAVHQLGGVSGLPGTHTHTFHSPLTHTYHTTSKILSCASCSHTYTRLDQHACPAPLILFLIGR